MRRLLSGMNVVVAAALALALCVILNFLASRWDRSFDWTRQSAHTLDPRTRNLLDAVRERKEKVEIATFFAPDPQQPWQAELRTSVTRLLERYKSACPGLEITHADFYGNPAQAKILAERIVGGPPEANTVALRCADRRKTVKPEEMATPEFPDRIREFKGEDAVSTALQAVLNPKGTRILYVTGHGERALADEKDPNAFQILKMLMDRESLSPKEGAVGNEPLEGRWDLVIVGGPQSPWLPDEVESLNRYLLSGGRVLLMLDPVLGEGNKALVSTGLEALAGRWGVSVRDELVIDLKRSVGRDAENRHRTEVFSTTAFTPGLPITRGMGAGIPLVLALARPVEPSPSPTAGFTVAPLVRSEGGSWAKRDFRDLVLGPLRADPRMDRAGPHVLGVQVEVDVPKETPEAASDVAQRSGGRAVILGDADLASTQVLSFGQINRDFVFNSLYWLLDRQESMGITAKSDLVRISLAQDQLTLTSRLVQYVAPTAFLLVGLLVWWFRRH